MNYFAFSQRGVHLVPHMTPTSFTGQNTVFAEDQPEYQPLPAFRDSGHMGAVVTCWELTDEELTKVLVTKRIWVTQLTFQKPLQPQLLSVKNPLK